MSQSEKNDAFARTRVDAWFVKGFNGMVNILVDRCNDPLPLTTQQIDSLVSDLRRATDVLEIRKRHGK